MKLTAREMCRTRETAKLIDDRYAVLMGRQVMARARKAPAEPDTFFPPKYPA